MKTVKVQLQQKTQIQFEVKHSDKDSVEGAALPFWGVAIFSKQLKLNRR